MAKRPPSNSVDDSARSSKQPKFESAEEDSTKDAIVKEKDYEVIIVGAGPAGIGLANALRCGYMDSSKLLILEQGPSIGTSFRQWHKFTRFISPSWPSFPFGPQDLNAIFPDSSLNSAQHPTGDQYADYLEDQADNYTLNINFNQKVSKIERNEKMERFFVYTEDQETPFYASCVVWCGGEWSYPATINCEADKNSTVHYKDVDIEEIVKSAQEEPVVVVGMGEAGADTACALAEKGVSVVIVDGNDPSEPPSKDPSCRLSSKSIDALERYSEKIEVLEGMKCVSVSSEGSKQIQVKLADIKTNAITRTLQTKAKVVMCIGFDVSQNPVIKDLFHWRDDKCPELSESCDESTKTPNLFLVGPMVRHSVNSCNSDEEEKEQEECQTAVFCFVYKFRTRFALVAEEIIQRVINDRYHVPGGKDGEDILSREGLMWGAAAETMREFYKSKGMYLSEIEEACVSCD